MVSKKNKGKLLVEFIPYGGIEIGGMFGAPKIQLKRKGFKQHMKRSYGSNASFGKATDRGRKGWGIFIERGRK